MWSLHVHLAWVLSFLSLSIKYIQLGSFLTIYWTWAWMVVSSQSCPKIAALSTLPKKKMEQYSLCWGVFNVANETSKLCIYTSSHWHETWLSVLLLSFSRHQKKENLTYPPKSTISFVDLSNLNDLKPRSSKPQLQHLQQKQGRVTKRTTKTEETFCDHVFTYSLVADRWEPLILTQ